MYNRISVSQSRTKLKIMTAAIKGHFCYDVIYAGGRAHDCNQWLIIKPFKKPHDCIQMMKVSYEVC